MAYHNQGLQGPLDSSMEKLIMTETSCKCRKACGRKESKDGCKIEMELKLVCEYMKVRGRNESKDGCKIEMKKIH